MGHVGSSEGETRVGFVCAFRVPGLLSPAQMTAAVWLEYVPKLMRYGFCFSVRGCGEVESDGKGLYPECKTTVSG